MTQSDLTEFQIEEEGLKLRIKRGFSPLPSGTNSPGTHTHAQLPEVTTVQTMATQKPAADEANTKFVRSPMVGTFYGSSSPGNPPFIKIGDKIGKNTVVCILEAMKVMNEIHAEIEGVVLEILAENGQTIEYGQPLFKVKAG